MSKESKQKWEISVDFMLIIGKYFNSSKDYVNTMKVCKRYNQLVQMYHFNPISDCSLFEKIETQHFYHKEDVEKKREGMFEYIYWIDDEELKRNKKDNEIFKDIYINKVHPDVILNMNVLEEWSGKKYSQVVFDSSVDKFDGKTLKTKVVNKDHLYFIVVDDKNNVFGHYHCSAITENEATYDDNIFMFTLNSNGRCSPKKFDSIHTNVCTSIYEDDLFSCDNRTTFNFTGYIISTKEKNSCVWKTVSDYFKDLSDSRMTGNSEEFFTVKQVTVLKMI